MRKPIYTATSSDSAILVSDYPYGSMRCQIQYWIEYKDKKGYRFMSQTRNPKNGVWNKPKPSTYQRFAGVMYLNTENNHIEWTGLSEYSSAADIEKFLLEFSEFKPNNEFRALIALNKVISAKVARGESVISFNGVPCMPSEARIEEARLEVECFDRIKAILVERT